MKKLKIDYENLLQVFTTPDNGIGMIMPEVLFEWILKGISTLPSLLEDKEGYEKHIEIAKQLSKAMTDKWLKAEATGEVA